MSTEPTGSQPSGDGILSDLGNSDFGSMIGGEGGTPPPATPPAQTGPGTTPATPAAPATQQPAEGAPPAQPTPPPAAPPSSAPQQNVTDIIRATVDSTAAAFQRQQSTPAAPVELSPQEFDAKYGIVRANEQMITHLLGQDPRQAVAVLDHLFQANLTASLRMANDVMEAKLSQLQEQYRPIAQSYREQQQIAANTASESRFFAAHADLVNEKGLVMEMKDAFIAKVQAGQIKFATEAEAFAAVANATRSILNRLRPAGAPGTTPGTNAPNARPQNGRQMVTASSAGRQSTASTGAAKPKDIVEEVFGADAR